MTWFNFHMGTSIEELAQNQYEELLGFQGTGDETVDALEGTGGHKPPRHDIGKLKQLHDLYQQQQHPDDRNTLEGEQLRHQWETLTQMDADEHELIRLYDRLEQYPGSQDAYKDAIDTLSGAYPGWQDTWTRVMGIGSASDMEGMGAPYTAEEARQVLNSAIKKQQIASAPRTYQAIRLGLDRLKRDYPESYKLWPWYVKQVKNPGAAQFTHLSDVVGNAGKVLAEERRQNRLPQNFDINQMDFDDLEQWYMDWKKENRQSESQGETVYEWDDGWTMQRLTTEEQLQYEGDEQGHCVGDYCDPVFEGRSIIYSLRDPKGNPHVTIEMEGPELLTKASDKPLNEYTAEDVKEQGLSDAMRGNRADYKAAPVFENGQDHLDYANYRGMGRENKWPSYHLNRQRVTPHSVDENQQYYNSQGVPWDKSFYVVQVQGNSNSTPKPEYQSRVKEFLDYLKSKGFNFERSGDWYPNHDARDTDPLDGWEDYATYAGRYGSHGYHDAEDSAMGWYEHYQEHPGIYLGDEDEYGIKRDQRSSGYSPGVIRDTLEHVLEGADPDHAAKAFLHLAMNEDWPYADVDQAVREAENWMNSKQLDDQDRAWQTDNGTWVVYNEETGQDEEHQGGDLPEDAYFSADEDPKYIDGYKFINAVDQYLVWYYDNKQEAQRDKHPAMTLPKLQWTGENIPDGFREGTDPYAPSPEEQTKAEQQAQQDAGPGFSTMDLSGVFSRRLAMAERTGDPTLDKLIDEFYAENPVEAGYVDPDLAPEDYSVHNFGEEGGFQGLCHAMGQMFADFLIARGISAWSSEEDVKPSNLQEHTPEAWGYSDREVPGGDYHVVTKVRMPSGTYMIDWTAAQYGYKEFPMVQRLNDGGSWDRQWTSATVPSGRVAFAIIDGKVYFGQVISGELGWEENHEDIMARVPGEVQALGEVNGETGQVFINQEWTGKVDPSFYKDIVTRAWARRTSAKTADTEHDPDYVFVYYMSELRVERWEVNARYEKLFEQLLDEFNVDLGNSALDIDPADVAAGEIRIRKGVPVIEHKQLCPPEIREQAEDAIGQWWAKQWFEGLEFDWYAPDVDHTLTGDA